jgi:phage tail-like protein
MEAVSGVRAVPHLLGRGIDLEWQNPRVPEGATELLAGVRVVRRERTFPLDASDGVVVYDGPVVSRLADRRLKPLTTYYYTVFAKDNLGKFYADEQSRVAAFATDDYGLGERLYNLLPAVHLRHDALTTAEQEQLEKLLPGVHARLAALPAGLRGGGPLRRFLHAAAAPLSAMRSTAEGLRRLYDLDHTPPQFLLSLAHWVGWEPDRTLPVFAQRNEIRFAPTLYRSTGTAPNLRALVTRYSGWDCRVAEFAQNLARTNSPPRLNVCSVTLRDAEWRGSDDAAPVLGFGAANSGARGSGAAPARLTGDKAEPFALREGMELTVSVDGRLPALVRFRRGDFTDISQAKASEVAAVLNRLLGDVTARTETAGNATRLLLSSNSKGINSSLRVEADEAALISLEGAPAGRLSACLDHTNGAAPRARLFYETSDPLARVTERAALRALDGEAAPQAAEEVVWDTPGPLGRLRYKTFRAGRWSESLPVTSGEQAQGSPAAVQLTRLASGNKRLFLAWIEKPHTDASRLRYALGVTSVPQRARLVGHRNQPFVIEPGTTLFLRGNWPVAETFRFAEADFADPRNVTAEQLVAVLRARLNASRVVVSVQSNGAVAFSSAASGGEERLELDLSLSSAAAALGFDERNASAVGDWGDEIDWGDTRYLTSVPAGRYADLHAVVGWDGNVWLFWASHAGGLWRIMHSRWDGANWSTPQTLADGPGNSREPYAVVDITNRVLLYWSRRDEADASKDIWTLRSKFCTGYSWSGETAFTSPAAGPGARSADREASAVRMSDNSIRVFFRSDRAGGPDLWYATGGVGVINPPLTPLLPGATADHVPSPIYFPDNTLWLFFRSDRSFSPSRLLSRPLPPQLKRVTSRVESGAPPPPPSARSVLVGDAGTLRRHAGTTAVVLKDIARSRRRRLWDDLLSYTPQSARGEPLGKDDLYTRGAVGLYLSEAVEDSPLSRQTIERLRTLLDEFLPISTRAVVVLSPRIDREFVYDDLNVLTEVLLPDKYPAAEFYDGPSEGAGAPPPSLPGWQVIHTNRADHVSAILKPEGAATWKLRTYYPPPE